MDWLRYRSRRLGTKIGPKSVRFWGAGFLLFKIRLKSSKGDVAEVSAPDRGFARLDLGQLLHGISTFRSASFVNECSNGKGVLLF